MYPPAHTPTRPHAHTPTRPHAHTPTRPPPNRPPSTTPARRVVPYNVVSGLFVPHTAGFAMQRSRLVTAVCATASAVALAAPASAQMLDSSVISAFRWRNVGPSNFMG